MRAGENKRRGRGKQGLSGETAGGGSPRAWRSEGEGSLTTRTGASGMEGGPSHQARAARTEGKNTGVARWTGTSGGIALPPRTGISRVSGEDEHLGLLDQSIWGRRAPAWIRRSWGTRQRGRSGRLNATVDAAVQTVGKMEASRSVRDGAGCAKATANQGTVRRTGYAAVYPAHEEGGGQREDAPGLEHAVRR